MVMEYEIPIIEMRIRGLGRDIVNAFMSHSDELRPLLENSVNKYLSSGNIKRAIDEEVEKSIRQAIQKAISSYEVVQKIEKLIREKAFEVHS